MTQLDTMPTTDTPVANGVRSGFAATAWELGKPGIVQMVTITSVVGFIVAALGGVGPLKGMGLALPALGMLVGTVLSAAGANALNQAIEHERDARMQRTAGRPIPSGRMSVGTAWIVGLGYCTVGVAVLGLMAGLAPALVALVTILSYLAVYTPLKPKTTLATVIGAVPGALPPLIGWTAAAGGQVSALADLGGWALFTIVFVWQMPHFLAIAWMYREDYARGGYRVLPVADPNGRRTGFEAVIWAALLIPVSLSPAIWAGGIIGPVAVVLVMLLGVFFFLRAVAFLFAHDDPSARRLFLASIIYLPVVLVVLVCDAAVHAML